MGDKSSRRQSQSAKRQVPQLLMPVSPGELLDRLVILEIKLERLTESDKIKHTRKQYNYVYNLARPIMFEQLVPLVAELKDVHKRLWDVIEKLHQHESNQKFDQTFIELSRDTYILNDRRLALKNQIDQLSGAEFTDRRSYID